MNSTGLSDYEFGVGNYEFGVSDSNSMFIIYHLSFYHLFK